MKTMSFPIVDAFFPFQLEEEVHVIFTEAYDIFKYGGERIHSPQYLEVIICTRSYFFGFCFDYSRPVFGTASSICGEAQFWDEAETLQNRVDNQYPWASNIIQISLDRVRGDAKTRFATMQKK